MKYMLWHLVIIGFAIGFPAFVAVSWISARSHTAPFPTSVGSPPKDFPVSLEEISFVTTDGLTLRGWYAPGERASSAMILLHPFRSNRLSMLARARFLNEAGYGVLLYDARAQGESDGEKISVGYYETKDLLAAVRYLQDRGLERIGCLGVSQGAATVLLAAEQLESVRAVIVDNTYDTALRAVDRRFRRRFGLPGWLAGALYRPFTEWILGVNAREISPYDRVAALTCPLLLIGGANDPYIRPDELKALYDRAPEPKHLWLVENAGHVDFLSADPNRYQKQILRFLDDHL